MSKSYGAMVGAEQAVAFLEQLQHQLPDGGVGGDTSFWLTYERVLNRVRYMADMVMPIAPNVQTANVKRYGKYYTCGNCGGGLRPELDRHCPKCGRQVKWSAVFPERWP